MQGGGDTSSTNHYTQALRHPSKIPCSFDSRPGLQLLEPAFKFSDGLNPRLTDIRIQNQRSDCGWDGDVMNEIRERLLNSLVEYQLNVKVEQRMTDPSVFEATLNFFATI